MAIQIVNTGTSANSGDGDSIRSAFNKVNANFNELYNLVGSVDTIEDRVGSWLTASNTTGIVITYNTLTNTATFTVTNATTQTVGGIVVGNNLTITDGVLSGLDPYVLPIASVFTLGGGRSSDTVLVDENARFFVPPATTSSQGVVSVSVGLSVNSGVLSLDLSNVNQSILPSADLTYDLGSSSTQWRSLYLGTSTIYLGGTAVSVNNGSLTLNGNPIIVDANTADILFTATTIYGLGIDPLVIQNTSSGVAYLELPVDPSVNDVILANQDSGGAVTLRAGNFGSEKDWRLDSVGNLVFPDGTTSTGSTVYVPYATSSSFRITTEIDMIGSYLPATFEVKGDRILLPNGNGLIQSGEFSDAWGLDSTNKSFTFPNQSDINYGDGTFLSTGTLQVRIDFDGDFRIFLNEPNKTWIFNSSGNLELPGNLVFSNGAEIRDFNGNLRLRGAPGETAQLQGLNTDGAVDSAVKALHDNENGSYVTINTNIDAGSPEYVWTFDYNGKFIAPGQAEFDGNIFGGPTAARLYLGGNDTEGSPSIVIPNDVEGTSTYIWIQNQLGGGVRISTDQHNWEFIDNGSLTVPGNIVGYQPDLGYERVVLQPSPAVEDRFLFYVDQTAGTFNRAGMELPNASNNKAVTLAFPHSNNTAGYIFNQGTDTIDTDFNNALNLMMNTGSIKLSTLSAGPTRKIWTFGTDGSTTFPDGTVQLTAFTGTSALLDITNTNGLGTTYYLTFVEDRTTGQEVRADVDLTYQTADNILGVGKISVNSTASSTSTTTGALTVVGGVGIQGDVYAGNIYSNGVQLTAGGSSGVTSITAGTGTFVSTSTGDVIIWTSGGGTSSLEETFESKTSATSVVIHDCTTNRLFYHTGLLANFTPNFTNLNLSAGEATSISLVMVQGATARMPTAVQIESTTTGVTLLWQGASTAPAGNANRTDVVTFSILSTGTSVYTVLGMLTSFGGGT